MRAAGVVGVGVVLVACGARTELTFVAEDAAVDARDDVVVNPHDANGITDSPTTSDAILEDACESSTDPSFGATQAIDACSEGQNISSPLDTNCNTTSVAWEYVPAHDIDVTRLELDVIGGGVALYDSDDDSPGPMLFQGSFDSGPQTWRGVDVTPPIHLTACHVYFIQQVTTDDGDPCSIAADGVAQRQFNPPGFDGPGWGGPYIWLPWSAHIIGTCP